MPSALSTDYTDLAAVCALARSLARGVQQYVVKYPNRANYNVTMQLDRAIKGGADLVAMF